MDNQSSVPYLAYKSKRHSRTVSVLSSQSNLPQTASPPPSRPSSSIGFVPKANEPSVLDLKVSSEKPTNGLLNGVAHKPMPMLDVAASHGINSPAISSEPSSPTSTASTHSPQPLSVTALNGKPFQNGQNSKNFPASASSSASTVTADSKPPSSTRRTSTFRRLPLRDARASLPVRSSPLNTSSPLSPLRQLPSPASAPLVPHGTSQTPFDTLVPESHTPVQPVRSPSPPPPKPPPKNLSPASSTLTTPATPMPLSRLPSTATAPRPSTRFYRAGFQPGGVYRHRTEQFVEARRSIRNLGKIETTRLERRLEKLINLHFLDIPEKAVKPPPTRERRVSSFFELDFSDLRNQNASDLWKGVLQSQASGGKNDIRAAEQKITPWEDDAAVSQCPLCLASFHPITNRKHHCRLCGRIMCSLPVKAPQRPVTCSILFVADPQSGKIEEVGEGVDYGVRRRTVSQSQTPGGGRRPQGDDEKFLKGVRICRDCRPVLLRQQYMQEASSTPVFFKLYDLFVSIEKEIEDALPQFQELLLSLKNDEQPTAEASAARKRLLEAFTQYDALAKRIRNLHCPGGPGSSQDRIQTAILTRANLFLQKNMFPLQSLPKPAKRSTSGSSTPSQAPLLETNIDPDSELAHALQPLLEQEALLETFVQEAKSHRKFEDAQTLKTNLEEIRAEIDRIVANADRGVKLESQGRKPRQIT